MARPAHSPVRHLPALGAVAPAVLYVCALLVVPFAFLLWLSVQAEDPFLAQHSSFTLRHYGTIATSPLYRDALLGTLKLGLAVTLLTLVLGYPVALFIAQSGSRLALFVMAVVILPLFVSVVVRSFGWMVLFGRHGLANQALVGLGITAQPMQLLYTPGAVIIGLVHILAPLMILPIASVLRGLDPMLPEAARSLGASRLRVFLTVTLPLSLPGVAAGCVLVLAHVIAAFVLPALIGSDRVRLMATMIYQQVMVANEIPLGSALAVVMVAATFLLLGTARLLLRRWHD
jgi:putative spermidine/putrescine transport system permease protein